MKNEINVGYYRVSVDTTGNEDSKDKGTVDQV